MFTKLFWKDAVERAVSTGAQAVLTGLALSDVTPVDAFAIDWRLAGGFFVGGTFWSLVKAVAVGSLRRDTVTISPASAITP